MAKGQRESSVLMSIDFLGVTHMLKLSKLYKDKQGHTLVKVVRADLVSNTLLQQGYEISVS